MQTLEPLRLQDSVLFHDVVCHAGSTDKNSPPISCSGGRTMKGRWISRAAAALSLPFTADFFTLVCVPKVSQAVLLAIFLPEQGVTMNECVHRELYLYVQAAIHEMTG